MSVRRSGRRGWRRRWSSPRAAAARSSSSARRLDTPARSPVRRTPSRGSATTRPASPSTSPVGSPRHPVVVTAGQQTCSTGRPSPARPSDLVTVGDGWTLTVTAGGATARLDGPQSRGDHPRRRPLRDHRRVPRRHTTRSSSARTGWRRPPTSATLVDLDVRARARTLDGRSDPPTSVGGTWALGPDTLVHATVRQSPPLLPGHRRPAPRVTARRAGAPRRGTASAAPRSRPTARR